MPRHRLLLLVGLLVLVGSLLLSPLSFALVVPLALLGSIEEKPPAETDPVVQRELDQRLLQAECGERARQLEPLLGDACNVIVRAPFVLAGDLSPGELDRWHRDAILPAVSAMRAAYFSTEPDAPVTVLLFSDRPTYEAYARRLFGDEDLTRFGYYKTLERTLVINISTGPGTLVHELTHALVAFDFPAAPDWFDEGLASLYETTRQDSPSNVLQWGDNFRLPTLQRALATGSLRPLRELMSYDDFRVQHEGLNYAHARYFCAYLDDRGVLRRYYQEFRNRGEGDPRGELALAAVFPSRTWREIEADFRTWVLERSYQPAS